jgi:hypothetical protein
VLPLLGAVCSLSAATVVILGTRLTFFNDDWYFLLQRPGLTADSVFAPHNGHLSALAVLIYKGLVELFGLGPQLPFRLVLAATLVGLGIAVYALVSERAGRLLGLVAATIILFLGSAWEDLLWSFQIGLVGSLAVGLAALIALERDSGQRNAVACLLLVVSISLSDLGIPFVVAAAIAVALRRRAAQLWIAAIPAALFVAWWVTYGSDAPSYLSWTNLRGLPEYILDSVAAGLASLTGLTEVVTGTRRRLLVLVAAIAVAAWLMRGGRPSARVLVFLGAALTFWGLAGANFIPGREPFASRYQLVHATFLILIAAELFRPIRLAPAQAAAVLAIALLALGLNLRDLGAGYHFMRDHSAYAKVDIGALEITRRLSRPNFQLLEPWAHDPYLSGVTAERYFTETDAHGSPPTYVPPQIEAAPPLQRLAADHVIAAAYGLHLEERRGSASEEDCRRHRAGVGEVELYSGGASIANMGARPLALGVRRFGSPDMPLPLGRLGANRSSQLAIPPDSLGLPWHLTVRGVSAFQVCRL